MTDQNTPQQSLPKRKKIGSKKTIVDTIISLGPAFLLVLMIRSSVIEAFKIPSGSMIPTLLVGDQIFVNKFSYGLRVPFTDWVGERPLYFFKRDQPSRGDIIVFKYPVNPDIYFIKRVIGVPGDTVEMKNKVVFINGKPFEQNLVDQTTHDKIIHSLDQSEETDLESLAISNTKFDHTTGTTMINKMSTHSENFPPLVVPPESYFAMGDNRDNSKDSRYWGFVPFDNIKGRAFVIWLSMWFDFSDFSKQTFRPERIGTILK